MLHSAKNETFTVAGGRALAMPRMNLARLSAATIAGNSVLLGELHEDVAATEGTETTERNG